MSARKPELVWDPRPLPAGWSSGYDEGNQRCCYFRHDTTPPSISFVHPLDIGLDSNISQVGPTPSGRSVSRPLPKPPGSLPSYEPALSRASSKKTPPPSYANPALPPPPPILIASSPPSKAVFPTPPLKPQSQFSATMRNPPAKLSAAQQLYASSLANNGLSGPSLSLPPPVIETRPDGPDQPSLYKYPVAGYASSAPPSALRSRSPTSTISSRSSAMSPRLMASPSSVYSSEPQSPPYSEFSLPDDEPREFSPGSSSRARLCSTPHTRGHSESDGYLRPVIPRTMQENAVRITHATTHNTSDQTRSLFPLRYVDVNGGTPEVRNVSTIAKPPPASRTGASVANQVGTITSNPFPSQLITTSDTPRPAAPFVVGAPVHGQAPAVSTTHLTMPSAQPASAAQFTGPISPPSPSVQAPVPPPPPPANLQPQQQIPVAPVRPSHNHNHSYPNSPLQPQFSPPPPPTIQQQQQQHNFAVPTRPPQNPPKPMSPPQSLPGPPRPNTNNTTNGATRPPKPPRPNAKPSGFMSSFGSSLASSLGKTAVSFGTQALLSGLGIEEEGEEEGGGIADALVSGFSSLTTGGDEGGGEPPPAPAPGAGEYTTVYDPGAYATPEAAPVPPEAAPAPSVAPPPQPVSAVPMAGGEYQTAYSAGFQYTSYSVELPSIEFNYSSGSSGGGNNANNPNGNYSGKPWNTMTNQQNTVSTGGNMYSGHPSLPSGAQQPFQSHQSLQPAYRHPQSMSWNPYQYQ